MGRRGVEGSELENSKIKEIKLVECERWEIARRKRVGQRKIRLRKMIAFKTVAKCYKLPLFFTNFATHTLQHETLPIVYTKWTGLRHRTGPLTGNIPTFIRGTAKRKRKKEQGKP